VVSRCLSAAGIRFSVIRYPPGSWALLAVGLPDLSPDPDGVTTFRTHELRSGWAPSVPRGRRCSPRTGPLPGQRLPHRSGMSLYPTTHPTGGDLSDEASTKGSHMFARPIFPSLWPPGWNGPPLGIPLGFAPRRPRAGRRTPGQGQAIEHGPGTTRSTHITSISNPVVLS
jgi:hypothetical protein